MNPRPNAAQHGGHAAALIATHFCTARTAGGMRARTPLQPYYLYNVKYPSADGPNKGHKPLPEPMEALKQTTTRKQGASGYPTIGYYQQGLRNIT